MASRNDHLNMPLTGIEDAMAREYPAPCAKPCNDCPWRRAATPGWLGPYDADKWLDLAHGETPIACHQTIPPGGGWGDKTTQCKGAAIFRANVHKNPRNASITTGPRDEETVFATNDEFKAHHERRSTMDPEQDALEATDRLADAITEEVEEEAERLGISTDELLDRVVVEVKTRIKGSAV